VDPVAQGVPNYLAVVHEPMDLKTIERRVGSNRYEHIAEFYGDVNKIFLNSYKFNPKETNYYTLTVEFEAYYHELLKDTETRKPSKTRMQPKSSGEFGEETGKKRKKGG
jgi:hypothetical protein